MDRKETFLFKVAAVSTFFQLNFYILTNPLKLYNELEEKKKKAKKPRVHRASPVATVLA